MKYFALLAGLLMVVACGSSDHGGFVSPSDGGSGGSGGKTAHAGAAGKAGSSGEIGGGDGGEGGVTDVNLLAPLVTIISPVSVTDPNVGPVVLDKVHVVCTATASEASGATFSASTVSIEAFDTTGTSIQKISGTQNIEDMTQFFADFNLTATKAPNGAISFKCSAGDLSTPANVGSAVVHTFIDHGPTITIITPALPTDKGVLDYYPFATAVPFRFTVVASPLADSDTEAAVAQVTLTIDNVAVDLSASEDPKNKGSYKVDVKLNDAAVFQTIPSGPVPVKITATNKRSPVPADHTGPVMATIEYNFGIDGAGPIVTIVSPSPLNAPVVGVSVKLQFTVTDEQSGVDPGSVNVTLEGNSTNFYDPASANWTRMGDTYTYSVANTTQLKGSKIQLNVTITAKDIAKNTSLATTAQYWLDTTLPIVDLDPPNMEELKPNAAQNGYICSDPFDVLGAFAPSEGSIVLPSVLYRALVWDETNVTGGQMVYHYAGIDPTTVRLYAQDNAAQPLLIDTDGDGTCDALATEATQGVLDPPVPVQLDALDATGTASYTTASPVVGGCMPVSANGTPPQLLCSDHNSDLTRVIDHAISGFKEDVIYTATSAFAVECTGKGVDLSGSLSNGWVCLAAEATDRVGNHGISAPIRICFNDTTKPAPACVNSSVAKPSCVSNCTPPGHFNPTYITRLN
jgi:hypothetical protein